MPKPTATPPDTAIDDFDSPWKEVLELFFPQALQLLQPQLYELIDWTMAPEHLNNELQTDFGKGKYGRRFVDKLTRVRLRNGYSRLLLIHVEIQGQVQGAKATQTFAQRMYHYHTLIRYHYPDEHLSHLGVLIDNISSNSYLSYTDMFLDQGVKFRFPVIPLRQWQHQREQLHRLAFHNPFAVVVLAQLDAIDYRQQTRITPKLALVRCLKNYGYTGSHIMALFRFIDWVLRLPRALEPQFYSQLKQLDQEQEMAQYVTSFERIATEKGREEGLQQGMQQGQLSGQAEMLVRLLQHKFSEVPQAIVDRIRQANQSELEAWSLNIFEAETLDELFNSSN